MNVYLDRHYFEYTYEKYIMPVCLFFNFFRFNFWLPTGPLSFLVYYEYQVIHKLLK